MANDLELRIGVVGGDDLLKVNNSFIKIEKEVRKLAKAQTKGQMNSVAMAKAINQLRDRLVGLGFSSKQAEAAILRLYNAEIKTIKATKELNQAQMAATKSSNRMGVVTQQVGYQVSDFAIQVQSGTNVAVAFSQQASQLVGVLPLVAGSLGLTTKAAIALSAGLGIAIPLISSAVMVFMNMKEEADKAADSTDTFEDKLKSLDEKLKEFLQTKEALARGISLDELLAGNSLEQAKQQLVDANNALIAIQQRSAAMAASRQTLRGGQAMSASEAEAAFGGSLQSINEATQLLEDQAKARGELEVAQQRYNTLLEKENKTRQDAQRAELDRQDLEDTKLKFGEDSVEAFEKELELSLKALEAELKSKNVNENVLNLILKREEALQRDLQATAEKAEAEEKLLTLNQRRFKVLMDSIAANDKLNSFVSEERKELEYQNSLLQLQLQFGKDSAAAKQLQIDRAVENYEAELLAKDVAEDTVKELTDQYRLSLNLTEQLKDQVAEAREFKKQVQEVSKAYGKMLEKRVLADVFDPRGEEGTTATQALRLGFDPFADDGEEGKKSGSKKPDPLADLKKQLDLEQALIGKTEARKRIIQSLGVDYMKYGSSTIKSLEDQINKTIELRKENERFAEEVEGPLTDAFGDVADAFGDFIADGLKDFKDFTKSIVDSFKQMLAQMISAAIRNRIFIPITTGMSAGFGSSAAASTMSSFGGGGSFLGSMAGSLAGGAAAFGSGMMAGIQGFAGGFAGGGGLMGGLSGYGATLSATAANAGIMGTIGAAVPAIAAVALVIGAFSSKTKELDSGLKATIKTNDVLIESYRKMEKSRFFGLSKKKYTIADTVEGSPLEQQILQLQHGIMSMAKAIGVADDVFNDFLYSFNISLKGLNEDEKLKKINEELGKMGDAFASLIPNVEGLDQLNSIMNERSNLEIRLLQAQGNTAALREIEIAGTNEYNRALLRQVFAAEDARDAIDEVTNSLQENSFATKLQFERAKAYSRLGLDAPANVNSVPMNTSAAPMMSVQRDPSIEQLRKEMRSMHEETMVAYSKLIKNTKDNKNILRGWDIVGLPAERSA